MRNVKRGPQPESLRKNAKKWTQKLLEEIEKSKKTNTKVPDRYYTKYKKKDVREALIRMYGDGDFSYCCYCESIINIVSYEQIEHRMPMKKTIDKYPKKAFDWNNLHLACVKCNGHKSNTYNNRHPILDATKGTIKDHLSYEVSPSGKGMYRLTLTERGITTVKAADLDRKELLEARLKVYNVTLKAIEKINRLGDDSRKHTKIKMLRDMSKEEYGSLIEYALDAFQVEDG